jgi:hypothetical protein
MPETRHELHPETLRLLDRMLGPPPSHDRFAGPPIRWDQLDALALGDLWTTARKVSRAEGHFTSPGIAAGTARAILDRGKEMEPVFRGAACRDYLDLLALELENTADKNVYGFAGSECEAARFALSRCIELTFDDIGRAAGRFLTLLEPKDRPHLALALARLAGCEARILDQLSADLADSPLFVDELRAVAAFGIATNLASDHVRYPSLDASAPSDEFQRLSEDADYAVLTEATLRHAAERIRLIHDRTSPYAADKAFTVQESGVIARLARIALKRDESWLPPVLDALFRKVSLAPTAAKSLPSQSVAVALGHAVEAFPTPEAVATLRAVLHDIRHAGVKKKLQRNLGGAERGLADRPEVALRLPADQPVSKQQLTTLARCLEASLATGMVLGYADWRSRLAEHPQAKMLAGALVWRMGDGVSVMPSIEHGHLVLRDAAGATVTPSDDCRVTLWHPCEATGTEREAWRDRLASLRIKQPFKQVFREHYAVPAEELATACRSGPSSAWRGGNDGRTAIWISPAASIAGRRRSILPTISIPAPPAARPSASSAFRHRAAKRPRRSASATCRLRRCPKSCARSISSSASAASRSARSHMNRNADYASGNWRKRRSARWRRCAGGRCNMPCAASPKRPTCNSTRAICGLVAIPSIWRPAG